MTPFLKTKKPEAKASGFLFIKDEQIEIVFYSAVSVVLRSPIF